MNASVLATQALAIITPLIIKGGEALAQGIGKDLWDSVKSLFKRNNKEEVLDNLVKEPKNDDIKEEVKFQLATILSTNDEAKMQLESMVVHYQNQQQKTITASGIGTMAAENIAGNTITYHINKP